jgi:hypothetical protein
MFSWPVPSDGHIIVNLPFIIWWATSIGMSLILVGIMFPPWKNKTKALGGTNSSGGGTHALGRANISRGGTNALEGANTSGRGTNQSRGSNTSGEADTSGGGANTLEDNRKKQALAWKCLQLRKRKRTPTSGDSPDLELQVEQFLKD